MQETTRIFLKYLEDCDTTKILSLYQESASRITENNHRNFVKEQLMADCSFLQQLTTKKGALTMETFYTIKDPRNESNVAVLPLLTRPDTTMNLKFATLYIYFYPDRFFDGKILNSAIMWEIIKDEPKKLIKLPPLEQKKQ